MIVIVGLLIGFPTTENIIPQGTNCSIKLHYLGKRQSALTLLRQQRTPRTACTAGGSQVRWVSWERGHRDAWHHDPQRKSSVE